MKPWPGMPTRLELDGVPTDHISAVDAIDEWLDAIHEDPELEFQEPLLAGLTAAHLHRTLLVARRELTFCGPDEGTPDQHGRPQARTFWKEGR